MPITCHYLADQKVTIFVHNGTIPDDEFLSFYRTYFEDSRFDKTFSLLVDLRSTESTIRSSNALQDFAGFMKAQVSLQSARQPKVAVIAPEDISFGLARVFEAHSSPGPLNFAVFRTEEEALDFLEAPSILMNQLDEHIQLVSSSDDE